MISIKVTLCFALLAAAVAVEIRSCSDKNLNNNVQLLSCKPDHSGKNCVVKRSQVEDTIYSFTLDQDAESLKTRMKIWINWFNTPILLPGIEEHLICDKIHNEDGALVTCPLKAGTKYYYKDTTTLPRDTPRMNIITHWELVDGEKIIACFKIPVIIE